MTTNEHERIAIHVNGAAESGVADGIRVARNTSSHFDDPRIELVVQGALVKQLLSGTELGADLDTCSEQGVTVLACENSLARFGLEPHQLYEGVGTVPAAAAHLARRQFAGWAYVRV